MISEDCMPEHQARLTGHRWCITSECECSCHREPHDSEKSN